ncbi:MAG: hypothetical protein HF976_02410 [ANME-2 cluster archaeon]|nr:hypothetical protein [ANME-2 cluster archaeon]MBC2700261.1 hypothetical protein [ANME-2 cluster archaeon]MBC2708003.1 hypothetical protein [ANME-2 cluster archaeon]MBC2747818.1 hypothetical protein [ANME-2 cluster archaeon]MBC2762757.1 hypothetical protein [ANME-2 cluster archaeon]
MTHQVFANVAGVIILISVIIAVSACIDITDQQGEPEESPIKINASQAIEIVKQDPVAVEYMSENFKRPEWRGNKTVLVQGFETNNSALQEDETYWKVEMMERNCACSGIKSLYVVESYVSPYTGEIANLTTGMVSESNYETETCTSTACH